MNDSGKRFNLQNQRVKNQVNIGGDAKIGHVGDVYNQTILPGEAGPLFLGVPDPPRYGLVGRAALLDELLTRLDSDGGSTVSLAVSGAGGAGKSALAAAAARDPRRGDVYPDGVLWASLGPDGDPAPVLARWADALGLDPSAFPTAQALKEAVANALGARRVLLVLDDIWQAQQAELLRCGGPACSYLLTTRDNGLAAHFAGGQENTLILSDLHEDQALELLRGIAPQAVEADETTARDLVRQVGGLPLAVELLGGYLTADGALDNDLFPDLNQELLHDLDDPALRLAQAQARLGDRSGAGVSLADVVALSLTGFSAEERQAFYNLGAFAAKAAVFSRAAAEAVSGAGARLLARLVNGNLLEISGRALALHQVTADFARRHMDQAAQQRHADFYFDWVENNLDDWQGIDAAYEQIRWAWQNLDDEDRPPWAYLLAGHQTRRGYWRELLAWHNAALEVAVQREWDDYSAVLLGTMGWVYADLGYPQQALDAYMRAISLQNEQEDTTGAMVTLGNIGELYRATGYPAKAHEFFDEALRLARGAGDREAEATILNNIAALLVDTDEPQRGLELYEQTLQMAREAGEAYDEALALNNIANVYLRTARGAEARPYLEQGLQTARATGDRYLEARSLNNLGEMERVLGRPQESLTYYSQALEIMQEIGDRQGETIALANMAGAYQNLGRSQEALALYEQTLAIMREIGNRGGAALTLNNMAAVYYSLGQPGETLQYLNAALPLAREVGNRAVEAMALGNMGSLLAQIGRDEEGLQAMRQAVKLMQEHNLSHDGAGVERARYEEALAAMEG